MIYIDVDYTQWKQEVSLKKLSHLQYKSGPRYLLLAIDGPVIYKHLLDVSDNADYELNLLPSANNRVGNYYSREPFASKTLQDGKSLFKRIHGQAYPVTTGVNELEFVIPYNEIKINGIEIINGDIGDVCDFNVHDNDAGTISTVPDLKLNQFGFGVNIAQGFYRHTSSYDADMILGMKLKVIYTSVSDKTVYINFELNELK